jgi:plastocyanin
MILLPDGRALVGTYTYYCNLPGHDTMRGTLTVLENF